MGRWLKKYRKNKNDFGFRLIFAFFSRKFLLSYDACAPIGIFNLELVQKGFPISPIDPENERSIEIFYEFSTFSFLKIWRFFKSSFFKAQDSCGNRLQMH
jgi:hypothetical protein